MENAKAEQIVPLRDRYSGEEDDTARIQEALDKAAKIDGGGIVVFPRGTYKLRSVCWRVPQVKP